MPFQFADGVAYEEIWAYILALSVEGLRPLCSSSRRTPGITMIGSRHCVSTVRELGKHVSYSVSAVCPPFYYYESGGTKTND